MLKNLSFWIWAIFWLILDQSSKVAIATNPNLHNFPIWQGVFHLRYVTNSGAAFSLFSGGTDWLKWISLFVSLGLIIVGIFANLQSKYGQWRLSKYELWGYGCILGGALGNGIDRFRLGAVIDFLDFRLINFPIFNFADVAINLGLGLILISLFSNSSKAA
jgi:signal peptidase II